MGVNLNGEEVTLQRRERPQVVVQDGVLVHIYHGALPPQSGDETSGPSTEKQGHVHALGNVRLFGRTFTMVTETCRGPAPATDGDAVHVGTVHVSGPACPHVQTAGLPGV